jgi:hypothetical protein
MRPRPLGDTPRQRTAEGKRIELAVTIATVIEFAVAIALPVIVTAAATTGIAAGVLLLGTALAGFHDLAGVRRAEQGRAGTAAVSVSAGAQR